MAIFISSSTEGLMVIPCCLTVLLFRSHYSTVFIVLFLCFTVRIIVKHPWTALQSCAIQIYIVTVIVIIRHLGLHVAKPVHHAPEHPKLLHYHMALDNFDYDDDDDYYYNKFLQATGCLACRPTNSVNSLKAKTSKSVPVCILLTTYC